MRINQTYQDNQALLAELEFMKFVAQRGSNITKLKEFYPADFFVKDPDGDPALIEFKRRFCNHDKYKTTMISLRKYARIKAMVQHLPLDAYLFLQFNDGLYFLNIKLIPPALVKMGGRYDRADDNDQEPYVHWPIEMFTKFDK